jgi:membrane-associated protein
MQALISFILNIDTHLYELLQTFGNWTYLIIFSIVFVETGAVIMPFLPGDSLIFVVGAFAAKGWLNLFISFVVLVTAAILGDSVNYYIGHKLGRKVFRFKYVLTKESLERTEAFFHKHGRKTIILARFVPFFRTFAPFVAGIGKMSYKRFFENNVIGGVLWVSIFLFGGYFFGNIPAVEKNFSLVIIAILVLSVAMPAYEYLKSMIEARKEKKL